MNPILDCFFGLLVLFGLLFIGHDDPVKQPICSQNTSNNTTFNQTNSQNTSNVTICDESNPVNELMCYEPELPTYPNSSFFTTKMSSREEVKDIIWKHWKEWGMDDDDY